MVFKDSEKQQSDPSKGKARNLGTGLFERQGNQMAICKSYIKNPDALRFQKELFARTFGKHYSVLSRLTHCICQVLDAVPAWVKEMKERAARLVKHWKGQQLTLSFPANSIGPYTPSTPPNRTTPKPFLHPNTSGRAIQCGGAYRRFCPTEKWATAKAWSYGNNDLLST